MPGPSGQLSPNSLLTSLLLELSLKLSGFFQLSSDAFATLKIFCLVLFQALRGAVPLIIRGKSFARASNTLHQSTSDDLLFCKRIVCFSSLKM